MVNKFIAIYSELLSIKLKSNKEQKMDYQYEQFGTKVEK
jgi:hypothetical protein